ncbi:MAG: hypothetical protein Q9162_006030 [Coniocarpon cinnabarinum]
MNSLAKDTRLLFGGERYVGQIFLHVTDAWARQADQYNHAHFYGTLDIETLGGAGFASQRTANDSLSLDLAEYDGIQLSIAGADTKRYTLILKDSLLPRGDDGREQASVSYEYDFRVQFPFGTGQEMVIRIPFAEFEPTYRGRKQDNAKPLDTRSIKRLSFMVRSFFGSQKGDFSFAISQISAYKGHRDIWRGWKSAERPGELREAIYDQKSTESFPYPYRDQPEFEKCAAVDEKLEASASAFARSSWCCGLL